MKRVNVYITDLISIGIDQAAKTLHQSKAEFIRDALLEKITSTISTQETNVAETPVLTVNDFIPHKPLEWQSKLFNDIDSHKITVAITARQIGGTTAIISDACYRALATNNQKIAVLTTSSFELASLYNKIANMLSTHTMIDLKHLQIHAKPCPIELPNGSVILLQTVRNIESSRGTIYDCMYVDQYAFMSRKESVSFNRTYMPVVFSSTSDTTKKLVIVSAIAPSDSEFKPSHFHELCGLLSTHPNTSVSKYDFTTRKDITDTFMSLRHALGQEHSRHELDVKF